MSSKRWAPYGVLALLSALTAGTAGVAGQVSAPTKEQRDDAVAFKEFTVQVEQYLKLHKMVEKQLPALKAKEELPEMIAAHQTSLARKIREARVKAEPGDIFTSASREAFRHAIRSVFKDPENATAR